MVKSNTQYTFRGRIRPKEEKPTTLGLVELPHVRSAFVYKRLSSHEQVKKSVFSLAMQDALFQMAKEDGYPESMIIVEQRDLGFSGTLGKDERVGLAHMIEMIEMDAIESIYVVHISRLFRDQTLIDGLSFGELCKQHNVVLVMPNMRLNLRDKMHMRIYRMELERSADELELMKLRMGGAKELKAKHGYYASGSVPVGFVVNNDRQSGTYDKYITYEPHAKIVREIFNLFPEMNFSPSRLAKRMQREGFYIPLFPNELRYMETRSAVKLMKRHENGKGYVITRKFIGRAATNPAYIGWWVWGGEVLSKDNHPKLVDEELFWYIQEHLAGNKVRGKGVYSEPLMLDRLLYCENHERPAPVHSDHTEGRYRCHGTYMTDPDHTYCFGIITRVLDEAISEFVVSQCSYPEYAQRIIRQLKQGYDEAKARAEGNKRDYARLTAEIEKLKENLAYTKTQRQAEMMLQLIDERMKERERLNEVTAYPAGRIGDAINIESVTSFLANMRSMWESQPNRFKNEFLRIVLDRILLHVGEKEIKARIEWKTGFEQEILIERPPSQAVGSNKWTDRETETLKKNFVAATWKELLSMLPNRDYFAILNRANRLGLKRASKPHGRREPWTKAEDELLTRLASGKIAMDAALDRLERTPNAIRVRLKELGLAYSRFGPTTKKDRIFWRVTEAGLQGGNDLSDENRLVSGNQGQHC